MQLNSYICLLVVKWVIHVLLIYLLWNVNIISKQIELTTQQKEKIWKVSLMLNSNYFQLQFIWSDLTYKKIVLIHDCCFIATIEYDPNNFYCQVLQFQQQRNKQWVVVCFHYQVSFCLHASSIKTIIGSSSSLFFLLFFPLLIESN